MSAFVTPVVSVASLASRQALTIGRSGFVAHVAPVRRVRLISTTTPTMRDIGDKIQDGIESAKDKVKEAGQNVKEGAKDLGDKIQGKAEEAKDKAQDTGDYLDDKRKDAADNIKGAAQKGKREAESAADGVKRGIN